VSPSKLSRDSDARPRDWLRNGKASAIALPFKELLQLVKQQWDRHHRARPGDPSSYEDDGCPDQVRARQFPLAGEIRPEACIVLCPSEGAGNAGRKVRPQPCVQR
jgi:hypothetical protein